MGKYAVGDKVLLEMVIDEIRNNDYAPIWVTLERDDRSDGMWLKAEHIDKYASKTYEDGLNDAWELARKICGDGSKEGNYDAKTVCEIFGGYTFAGLVLDTFTYQQTLAKIEAYEKSQQIQVGDVVKVRTGAGSEHLGVVTQITANQNCACIVYADGSTEMNTANNMTKTNKHLDIEHLLEQIRGDE